MLGIWLGLTKYSDLCDILYCPPKSFCECFVLAEGIFSTILQTSYVYNCVVPKNIYAPPY